MADDTSAPVEEKAETTAVAAETPEAKATPKRKKAKRNVPSGQVHVLATFNNTIVTFTDSKGNVLTTSSAGTCGFRGSKKGTAYAAQVAAERAAQAAKQQYGFGKAEVFIKGIGLGRDAAVRVLNGLDIGVESITDVTGVPHGGVRPRKARRI
ncbi:MAG TPA: 30S ribosomal protein S11 [Candidatus Saccharimonadales bacterium]|jgi:small subunit ribosomal protein S11|nr:30S ribosomal protein S11 [Candidatus Saccharimonadales bacterium]